MEAADVAGFESLLNFLCLTTRRGGGDDDKRDPYGSGRPTTAPAGERRGQAITRVRCLTRRGGGEDDMRDPYGSGRPTRAPAGERRGQGTTRAETQCPIRINPVQHEGEWRCRK